MRPHLERARRDYTTCVCEALRVYLEHGHRFSLHTLDAGERSMASDDQKRIVFTIGEWESFIELLHDETQQRLHDSFD